MRAVLTARTRRRWADLVALIAVTALMATTAAVTVAEPTPVAAAPVPNGVKAAAGDLDHPGSFLISFRDPARPNSSRLFAWWAGLAAPVPVLGDTGTDTLWNGDLSPDGRLVAVERRPPGNLVGGVAVYETGGTEPLWTVPTDPSLGSGSQVSSQHATWSPSGDRLLFERIMGDPGARSMWVVDADGQNLRQVAVPARPYGYPTIQWVDDHTVVLFGSAGPGSFEIIEVNVDTGTATPVFPATELTHLRLVGALDSPSRGQVIAVVLPDGGDGWELASYHYMGTPTERRSGVLPGQMMGAASDGAVLYLDGATGLPRLTYLDDPAGSMAVPSPPTHAAWSGSVSWSPARPVFRDDDDPLPGRTFTVNTTSETGSDPGCTPVPGDCTLTEAILATNENPGPDTIAVAVGDTNPSFVITTPLPAITDAITFNAGRDGECSSQWLTIDGRGAPPGTPGLVVDQGGADPGGPSVLAGISVTGFPGEGLVIGNSRRVTVDCLSAGAVFGDPTSIGNLAGVFIYNSSDVTLGRSGDSVAVRGNRGDGLAVHNSQQVKVKGAHLGTPVYAGAGNGGSGALIFNSSDVRIHASRIGGNEASGVAVTGASDRVRIFADYSFQGNDGLGIDLGADGITANDSADGDSGPNDLVNAPTIVGVTETPGPVALLRFEHAPLDQAVRVDVYANQACDPAGAGEGETHLGTGIFQPGFTAADVIRVPLAHVSPGQALSATVTVAGSGTSEFSTCRTPEELTDPPPDPYVDPDGTDPGTDIEDDEDDADPPVYNDPNADGVVPVAEDDLVMVLQGEDTVWDAPGLLENDTGGPGGRAVELVGQGSMPDQAWTMGVSGALTVDGRLVAPGEYTGNYHVVDPDGTSNTATITFKVIPKEDPRLVTQQAPVARPDRILIAPGQTKTIAAPGLLGNDVDPNGDKLTAVQRVAGTLAASRVTLYTNGSVTIVAGGLAEGTYTFTYRAKDATNRVSNPATVTVIVDNKNGCPTPSNDTYSLSAGDTLTLVPGAGPLRNDTDPENNLGTIDVVGSTAATGETGSVAFSNNGLTLHRNGQLVIDGRAPYVSANLPPGSSTQRLIRYTLADTLGETCTDRTASIQVTFTGNQAPVAVSNQFDVSEAAPNGNAYQVAVGGTLRLPTRGLLANDYDPDGSRAALTSQFVDKQFAGGSVTVAAYGGFTLKAPSTGISVGDNLVFRYVAIDAQGARSAPATVTVRVTNKPPVLRPPVAVSETHTVHADEILYLDGAKSLLANDSDPDGQPFFLDPEVAFGKDPRVSVDRNGNVTFDPSLSEAGKTITYKYRVLDFDGIRSDAMASLTINIVPPRERCRTVEVRSTADLSGPAAESTGTYRHCYNLLNVTRFGFVDDSGNWRPPSPAPLNTSATGTPDDLNITRGDVGSGSSALQWFFSGLTKVVDISPGDPASSPTVTGAAPLANYSATSNWGSCIDLLGPPMALLEATKVKQIVRGLKRIPFLRGLIDEVVEASASYLSANAQASVKVLSYVLSAVDFFGEDSTVKQWFLDAVQLAKVDVRMADGTVVNTPIHAALILVIGGAEIVDNAYCKPWGGWTPASATVTVSGSRTGQADVTSESYVNGYLDNLDVWVPGDLQWLTEVSAGDSQVVGADLYTGS